VAAGDITMSEDFTATGSGKRFLADFSNAIVGNRFCFQTTTANSSTIVPAIPNGSGSAAAWMAFNSSSVANTAFSSVGANSSEIFFVSGVTGAGTVLPLSFYMASTLAGQINTSGNWTFPTGVTFSSTVALGASATATTAAATDNDTSVATTAFVGLQKATAVAAFNYRRTTNQTSGTTIIFPTAVYTEYPSAGANYNSATGVFTAPVDGLYAFEAQVTMGNGTGAAQQQTNELKISGGAIFAYDSTACGASNTITSSLSGTVVLTAGQQVIVNNSSPGLSAVYFVSQGYFSGHLIARI